VYSLYLTYKNLSKYIVRAVCICRKDCAGKDSVDEDETGEVEDGDVNPPRSWAEQVELLDSEK